MHRKELKQKSSQKKSNKFHNNQEKLIFCQRCFSRKIKRTQMAKYRKKPGKLQNMEGFGALV